MESPTHPLWSLRRCTALFIACLSAAVMVLVWAGLALHISPVVHADRVVDAHGVWLRPTRTLDDPDRVLAVRWRVGGRFEQAVGVKHHQGRFTTEDGSPIPPEAEPVLILRPVSLWRLALEGRGG